MKLTLALLAVLCTPILLGLAIWKTLASKRRWVNYLSIAPIAIVSILAWEVYFAFYPKEEFYVSEWMRNTGLVMPSTAVFIKKNASYPDIHGDYWAAAIIEVSPEEYQLLKSEVARSSKAIIDTTLQPLIVSKELGNLAKSYLKSELTDVYQIDGDVWFKIGFYKDGISFIFERYSS